MAWREDNRRNPNGTLFMMPLARRWARLLAGVGADIGSDRQHFPSETNSQLPSQAASDALCGQLSSIARMAEFVASDARGKLAVARYISNKASRKWEISQ
jgi:hypothetical protein